MVTVFGCLLTFFVISVFEEISAFLKFVQIKYGKAH